MQKAEQIYYEVFSNNFCMDMYLAQNQNWPSNFSFSKIKTWIYSGTKILCLTPSSDTDACSRT